MHKQVKPIIIFDSGVGGLSIYLEVKKILPRVTVVYCSDNAGFPYGLKQDCEVIDRTSYHLKGLVERYKPSLAIIACNTASTISLPKIRQEVDIPVVGVVPAIKTASKHSINRCIGLLATPATINRDYTNKLIQDFASDCDVIKISSRELVYIAERYLRGEKINLSILTQSIMPFFCRKDTPDTIVLGCTHFPLLKKLLQKSSPHRVRWVDSGKAIAHRVRFILGETTQNLNITNEPMNVFIYTEQTVNTKQLIPTLQKMGFSYVQCF